MKGARNMSDLIEVQLSRVILQQKDDQQFIHLKERTGERGFPIVIGFNEAAEIRRQLIGDETARPMTHDLITRIVQALGFELAQVIISDLKEATFFATLVLEREDGQKFVDCRPSDAIALAVQTGVPVFVARKVLDIVAPD